MHRYVPQPCSGAATPCGALIRVWPTRIPEGFPTSLAETRTRGAGQRPRRSPLRPPPRRLCSRAATATVSRTSAPERGGPRRVSVTHFRASTRKAEKRCGGRSALSPPADGTAPGLPGPAPSDPRAMASGAPREPAGGADGGSGRPGEVGPRQGWGGAGRRGGRPVP